MRLIEGSRSSSRYRYVSFLPLSSSLGHALATLHSRTAKGVIYRLTKLSKRATLIIITEHLKVMLRRARRRKS